MPRWLKTIVGVLLTIALIVIGWPFLLAGSAIVLAQYGHARWAKRRAVSRFRAAWLPQGKDLLLVYSNSPHWKQYVEDRWLPKWRDRAVVLNWSERRTWHRGAPEAALFRAFAGAREFNPLAIVVSSDDIRVVRFWRAFRDFKHGKDRLLRLAEA